MSEIKSTLDLVMEKTKHLTLSKAEKIEQQQDQFKRVFNGLLQKYLDNMIEKEAFGKELTAITKRYDISDNNTVIRGILDRIRLDQNNSALLSLLKEIFRLNVINLEALIDNYQKEIQTHIQQTVTQLKESLTENYAISGTAVVPDPKLNSQWEPIFLAIGKKYSDQLEAEKNILIAL